MKEEYVIRTKIITHIMANDAIDVASPKEWKLSKDQYHLVKGLLFYLLNSGHPPYYKTWGIWKGKESTFDKELENKDYELALSEYWSLYKRIDDWLKNKIVKDFANFGYERGTYYILGYDAYKDPIACKAIPLKSIIDSVAKTLLQGQFGAQSIIQRLAADLSLNKIHLEHEGNLQNIMLFELEINRDVGDKDIIGVHS